MTEFSYRTAIKPMVPGDKGDPKNMRILESMPVRSIITNPANGAKFAAGTKELKLRGASWAGDLTVEQFDVSSDFGASWQRANLEKPKNKYDWQRWTATLKLPTDGYFEIWTRATDSKGGMQPFQAGFWNPQGYGGNAMHRLPRLQAGGGQGMTRAQWDDSISLMIRRHNVPLDDKDRAAVLNYLEAAYPPRAPAASRGGWQNPFAM